MSYQSGPLSDASPERSMLESILDGDGKAWREHISTLPGDHAYRLMTIATSAAVFRKWPDDPALTNIVEYVTEIGRRFPSDSPVPPSVIESVIRGVFGETELLQGTASDQIILAEVMIVKSIGYDVLSSDAERKEYLSEVLSAIN